MQLAHGQTKAINAIATILFSACGTIAKGEWKVRQP